MRWSSEAKIPLDSEKKNSIANAQSDRECVSAEFLFSRSKKMRAAADNASRTHTVLYRMSCLPGDPRENRPFLTQHHVNQNNQLPCKNICSEGYVTAAFFFSNIILRAYLCASHAGFCEFCD